MKLRSILLTGVVLSVPAFAAADTTLERIALEIFGTRFGVNAREINDFRRDTRMNIWDMGPIYSMSRYSGTSAYEIEKARRSGKGWDEISRGVGMHSDAFNRLRNDGYFERDAFWDGIYRKTYGTRQDHINTIRRQGGTLEDLLGAALIGNATGRSPLDVFDRYRNTRNWDRTASALGFDFAQWARFGKRMRWEGKSSPADRDGHGSSAGKGSSGGGKGGGGKGGGGKGGGWGGW